MSKTPKGQPRGKRYPATIRFHTTEEVAQLLRYAKEITGATVSEIVRGGTMKALVDVVGPAVRAIDDDTVCNFTRLKLMKLLHLASKAALSLSNPVLKLPVEGEKPPPKRPERRHRVNRRISKRMRQVGVEAWDARIPDLNRSRLQKH